MIARAALQRFRLPLRRPLATARGLVAAREGVLLELRSRSGASGYGEALPLAGWPGETLDAAAAWLAETARRALGRSAREVLEEARGEGPSLARAAFETALLDLAAREAGVPLAEMLGGGALRAELPVNALLDGDEPLALAGQARAEAERGFRSFKVKLGAGAWERDLARVAALRQAIGPSAALRLDANGAFREAEAERALAELARFAPEYVEQPVGDVVGCARLRGRTPVPIALDESASDAASLERALRLDAADVLVLKLPPLGGPRAARAAALRARDAGMGVVFTSFLDSALGIAAALHCAASLPGELSACGLATGALLAHDLAALAPEKGALALPPGAGLGVAPEPRALARAATGPRMELGA